MAGRRRHIEEDPHPVFVSMLFSSIESQLDKKRTIKTVQSTRVDERISRTKVWISSKLVAIRISSTRDRMQPVMQYESNHHELNLVFMLYGSRNVTD
jgi:hypothetical protein